jgi:hypothetical protein
MAIAAFAFHRLPDLRAATLLRKSWQQQIAGPSQHPPSTMSVLMPPMATAENLKASRLAK